MQKIIVFSVLFPIICTEIYSALQHFQCNVNCCLPVYCSFVLWKDGLNINTCPTLWNRSCSCQCDGDLSYTLYPFEEWTLSHSLILSSGFKLDPDTANTVREVRKAIFSKVQPTPLRVNIKLVAVSSDVLENILDLDSRDCSNDGSFLDFVSGNILAKNSSPLTHRYGGHQFGSWAGQLGDGRAHLVGEYKNMKGERWELQLKGSGLTPYSRRGDGRAVLRSSVREFLCSEALHYLGIPTSRAASLVVSDDPVIRDQFYDGNVKSERAAIVLRVAPSWFRIGSLEILTENNEIDLLGHLTDFVIDKYYADEVKSSTSYKYVQFFDAVVNRTIATVAKWMAMGFAHGVCNTDNFSLLGITIDFGPFGFVDGYDPNFIPNTSDDEGRYSLERQPSVAMFNMDKLRLALEPLFDSDSKEMASDILESFNDRYQVEIMRLFRLKLGLVKEYQKDSLLVGALLYLMEETAADFTMTFRQLGSLTKKQILNGEIPSQLWALKILSTHDMFSKWIESYGNRLNREADHVTDEVRLGRMNSVNPRYVLRNWMAERVIVQANENNFSEVEKLLQVLSRPFMVQSDAEDRGYALPPPNWAKDLKVSCSS